MTVIRALFTFLDDKARAGLFRGEVGLTQTPCYGGETIKAITRAFKMAHTPLYAHRLPLKEFIATAAKLKSEAPTSGWGIDFVRGVLAGLGADPKKTYFDRPRLRICPPSDYLTSGVSYNYTPHRDTWYAHPQCVVNYWTPIFEITPENCLALFPSLFNRPINNSSSVYDHETWVNKYRFKAKDQVKSEDRPHPLPLDEISPDLALKLVIRPGDVMMFSGHNLHATVPNTSGKTRFSLDWRTVNLDDLESGAGPKAIDNAATGSTLSEYVRLSDMERFPA